MSIKPLFNCPDPDCPGECRMAKLPVTDRPYWCHYVTDAMRDELDRAAAEAMADE